MIKSQSDCGYVIYQATAFDTFKLGGLGVCDSCNNFARDGYLIPILNSYYCPDCYNNWNKRAKYYPEDIHIEKETSKYYEKLIGTEA